MKRLLLPILVAAALPAADSHIMPSMNAFTIACYKQFTGGDGNLILSPFNIATALSMALGGARVDVGTRHARALASRENRHRPAVSGRRIRRGRWTGTGPHNEHAPPRVGRA